MRRLPSPATRSGDRRRTRRARIQAPTEAGSANFRARENRVPCRGGLAKVTRGARAVAGPQGASSCEGDDLDHRPTGASTAFASSGRPLQPTCDGGRLVDVGRRKPLSLPLRILQNRLGRVPRPSWCTYLVCDRCNARCGMCESWKLQPGDEMTPAEVRQAFRKLNDLDVVRLGEGEAFLREDLLDVAQAVMSATIPGVLHITTNARSQNGSRRSRGRSRGRSGCASWCPLTGSRRLPTRAENIG